jgi:sugar phosphate isomerase/epimerase
LATAFRYSLNTATIQGQNLTLDQQIAVAAKAGYQGIEPWVRDVEKFRQSGGNLVDLGKKCVDLGLVVESAIGFPEWVVPEAGRRRQSLENLKKDLEGLKSLGCRRLAAPPAGATKATDIPLAAAAERFGVLARLTREFGMVAMVEVWGFSTFLNRLGDAAYIASECGSTNSAVLADIYHLYKGGSGFDGLGQLSQTGFQVFHINDYPSSPPPAEITDAHRVYPGDGVVPLDSPLSLACVEGPVLQQQRGKHLAAGPEVGEFSSLLCPSGLFLHNLQHAVGHPVAHRLGQALDFLIYARRQLGHLGLVVRELGLEVSYSRVRLHDY